MNEGIWQRRAQLSHRSSGVLPGLALDREDVPQPLFQQVGAVQPGIGQAIQASMPVWLGVRSSGFFHNAYRAPLKFEEPI